MSYDFLKKPNGKYKLLAKKKGQEKSKSSEEVGESALKERLEQEKNEC